jgi:hypothetical protein
MAELVSSTDRLFELLKENPEGFTVEELKARFGHNSISSTHSTLKRARVKFPQFDFVADKNGRYRLQGNNTDSSPEPELSVSNKENNGDLTRRIARSLKDGISKTDILKDLLLESNEGINKNILMSALKLKNSAQVYTLIHTVRQKLEGQYKIIFFDGIYKCVSKKRGSAGTSQSAKTTDIPSNPATDSDSDIILPQKLVEQLKSLSPQDAKEVIDLLKKAKFYKECAAALITASKEASALNSTLFL